MVLNKFLNGLPVIGLLAMLTACPVTDTGEVQADGTVTSKDPAVKALQDKFTALEGKVSGMMSKEEILKEIASIGKVDTTKHKEAWGKLAQIMADSQDAGCMFFYPSTVLHGSDESAGRVYNKVGSHGGSLKIDLIKSAGGTDFAIKGAVASGSKLTYTYKGYSVDGIYKLDGALVLTNGDTSTAVTATSQYISKLKLEMAFTDKLTLTAVDVTDTKTNVVFTFGESAQKKFTVHSKDATATKCPQVKTEGADINVKIGEKSEKILPADLLYKALFGTPTAVAD